MIWMMFKGNLKFIMERMYFDFQMSSQKRVVMKHESLASRVTRWARQFPGKTAVKSWNRSVSYIQLDRVSSRIAGFLHDKIDVNPCVIILLDRSPELIESILGLLKCGLIFVPIDPVLPVKRVETMVKDTGAEWLITSAGNYEKFKGMIKGLKVLLIDGEGDILFSGTGPETRENDADFKMVYNKNCYVYFTSGSTGLPKGVLGRQGSLAQFIEWEIKEFGVDEGFNVSQFTPPSFDPFLRDIFVPLAAGGTCCIPAYNTLTDPRELIKWIDENNISLVHIVPSLFKALAFEIRNPGCLHNLKYILLAGELLRGNDIRRFTGIFGDRVQLVNVYGPTETTLAKLTYRIRKEDAGRPVIPVGKPIDGARVMILDSNKQKCRVGKPGEIYIRTPFISSGYLNDPELNKKAFIDNPYSDNPGDIIYKTGDLGRLLPDRDVEILGRVDHQVKIRGARIESGEIESQLLNHEGVREAVVTAKEGGSPFLCAYMVFASPPCPGAPRLLEPSLTNEFRDYLSKRFPGYMIPSYFVSLESIPLTPNGKVDREALPDPRSMAAAAGKKEVAPGDRLEERLVGIWSELLGIGKEAIGVDPGFFELGGHSLNAIHLVSRIHREFHIKIDLAEVFKHQRLKELAAIIKNGRKEEHYFIREVEEKEYYALSSAQKRLYILWQMDKTSINYNSPIVMELKGPLDKNRLERSFQAVIRRHESLRTSFEIKGGVPVQFIGKWVNFEMEYFILPGKEKGAPESPAGINDLVEQFLRPFDLSRAPLFRAGLITSGRGDHLFLADMHHIAADGASKAILLQELADLYQGKELSVLPIQYKDFSRWQNRLIQSEEMKKKETYWLNRFKDDIPVLNMITDYERPAVQRFEGRTVAFGLAGELTGRLRQVAAETETTLYMVLLTAYNILLSRYSEQEDIVVGVPVVGRNHVDLQDIVGMFVNTLPMRNRVNGNQRFGEFLATIKENAINAYENQDYPFDELVNKLNIPKNPGRNPLVDVLFVSENFDLPELQVEGLKWMPYTFEKKISHLDLVLYIIERNGCIDGVLEYSTSLFKSSTAEKMAKHYIEILQQAAGSKDLPVEDIKISYGFVPATSAVLENDREDFAF